MNKKTHIHLVNYEMGRFDGILSKFAFSMERELTQLGYTVTVSNTPKKADINHHINYQSYIHQKVSINTLMVTHITTDDKMNTLKKAMKTADWGVCMSTDTEWALTGKGLKNISTILPAHDGHRKPIVIYIPTNVYPDECKREWMFTELVKHIDKRHFAFLIMGTSWKSILEPLVKAGLQVQYVDHFDMNAHLQMLQASTHALYFGEDEGSMGILDAASCGLTTIAPNVGFHQDIGIDKPFSSMQELASIFDAMTRSRVSEWTWENYAKQHVKLWKKLLKTQYDKTQSRER
jgi:hypothetical protein